MRVRSEGTASKGRDRWTAITPFVLAFELDMVTQWTATQRTAGQCFFLLADFFVVLPPADFDFELVLPLPLPLTAPCRPFAPWLERGSARGLADGTGSFQPKASIWLPTYPQRNLSVV